jgi:hypothetical protein
MSGIGAPELLILLVIAAVAIVPVALCVWALVHFARSRSAPPSPGAPPPN